MQHAIHLSQSLRSVTCPHPSHHATPQPCVLRFRHSLLAMPCLAPHTPTSGASLFLVRLLPFVRPPHLTSPSRYRWAPGIPCAHCRPARPPAVCPPHTQRPPSMWPCSSLLCGASSPSGASGSSVLVLARVAVRWLLLVDASPVAGGRRRCLGWCLGCALVAGGSPAGLSRGLGAPGARAAAPAAAGGGSGRRGGGGPSRTLRPRCCVRGTTWRVQHGVHEAAWRLQH